MLVYLQMIDSPEDRVKFERLYLKYKNAMYTAAYRLLEQREDAEDAVHQSFLRVAKHIDKICSWDVDDGRTASYLIVTAENISIDMLRERAHFGKSGLDEGLCDHSVCDTPFGNGPASSLAEAMDALPLQQKNLLLLRYDCGFSTRELAAMTGKSYSAVKKALWRAKTALAKELGVEGSAV